jgi:hypothetical protein
MVDYSKRVAAKPFRDGEYIFHYLLQCHVDRMEYNWHERCGQVWCRGPVDMSGAIALFTAIDEAVELICTYLEGEPDTVYRKRGERWEAGDLPP